MKLIARFALALVALVSVFTLAACGGGNGGGASGGLNIGAKGEELAYDKSTLEATAGQPVSLTFKNTSTGQNHNWVLVKGGDDVAQTVADSAASTADYLPTDKADVVANTKLLPGGQSETISFTAPAAGSYTYICTYPGHYGAGMKGTLTVK